MSPYLHYLEKFSMLGFLTCSMTATGLVIEVGSLLAPLRDKRFLTLALGLNFLLSPALAWGLARLFHLDPGLTAGFLLVACAAGAPFLPKLVALARADLSCGVALMTLLTMGTILFLPLALPGLIEGFHADAWEIARPMLLWILGPLLVGMLLRHYRPTLAARISLPLDKSGSLFLLVCFVILVATNLKAMLGLLGSGALLAAALHASLLFFSAWLLSTHATDQRAILGLGSAARNFGAALVPAATSLRDPHVLVMIVASAIVGSIISFTAANWVKRRILLP
ncbi:bile acid:sodium symporter family protein [Haloferula chungangensis]|uniref:Bile acid:sodium symporter family protein n=1 Tax=Haloferula chungangensis TaxID=1048331 RepID=A0ABW2L4J3_9BACT